MARRKFCILNFYFKFFNWFSWRSESNELKRMDMAGELGVKELMQTFILNARKFQKLS